MIRRINRMISHVHTAALAKKGRPKKQQFLALLLLLVALLCAACGEDLSSGSPDTTQVTPTSKAVPAPVLGDPLAAFTARYGDATQSDIDPTTYNINTGILGTGTGYQLTITSGRVSHIWIRIPFPDQGSKTLCWSFIPRDSTFVKLYGGTDPNDKVYRSKELASAFPASSFQDVGNTGPDQAPLPAPPGTFRVQYEPVSGMNVSDCTYWLGE